MEEFSLNILASSYECARDKNSESEVGWQWVSNLSRFHKIVTITKKPDKVNEISDPMRKDNNPRFEYYDLPRFFDFLRNGDIRHFIYYNLWQVGAYFCARRLLREEKFDLVHHLVYVNTWQPTYMGFLGIPLVFGPIGENPHIPFRIVKHYGIGSVFREAFGRFIKWVSLNFSPFVRKTYDKATRIIVINEYVYRRIRRNVRAKTFVHPAIGVSKPRENSVTKIQREKRGFRVLYVGRFVYVKGPDIALKAFLKFAEKHRDAELLMVGGGKMFKSLHGLVKSNPQGSRVRILGWLDRELVIGYMSSCDAFLFPTFEGGGMVVLEAMSLGKPVVCLDFGGPGDFITDECGIKVKVSTMREIIEDLAKGLERLYKSESERFSMGDSARKRCKELYSWEKKAIWMNHVYKEALLGRVNSDEIHP